MAIDLLNLGMIKPTSLKLATIAPPVALAVVVGFLLYKQFKTPEPQPIVNSPNKSEVNDFFNDLDQIFALKE
jgi:hypothetical protein